MSPREQEIQRRIALSETRVTKAVFPPSTNHHNTLFGGTALAWMDEVSFIAATRFCRLPLVTVSSDRIDFKHATPAGSIVELVRLYASNFPPYGETPPYRIQCRFACPW